MLFSVQFFLLVHAVQFIELKVGKNSNIWFSCALVQLVFSSPKGKGVGSS